MYILRVRNLGGYLRIMPSTLEMENISLFKYLLLLVLLLRFLRIQELSFTIFIMGGKITSTKLVQRTVASFQLLGYTSN